MKVGDLLAKGVPLIIAGLLWLFGEKGENKFVQEIWAMLKGASPPVAMVLFYLFMREQTERREAQKQCNERTVDFIRSTNLSVSTFDKVTSRFVSARRARPRRRA